MKMTTKILAPEQILCLKSQQFSDNEPGTLLKDFSSLLDFIGSTGIPISGKNHLLAIKLLPQLNQLMSNPLDVKLKRPLQKSFPHINGLYLLLRASGLSEIVIEKKEAKLILDGQVLADWHSMNSTERYFALLQAWWYRGHPEIIGEREKDFYFSECLGFFLNVLCGDPDRKAKLDVSYFRYTPGFLNLALMELFGFVRIEQNAALSGENWPISNVEPTALGHALFSYLYQYERSLHEKIYNDPSYDHETDCWSYELKTHLPAWEKDLTQPAMKEMQDSIFVFKVTLASAYRKIAVPGTTDLDELARSILSAFEFDNDHLYEFIYKNRNGITERVVHPYMESGELCTDECVVGELPLHKGMALTFHFDFGDDWRFQLVVESISSENVNYSEPTVIERHGEPVKQYPDWEDEDDWDEAN